MYKIFNDQYLVIKTDQRKSYQNLSELFIIVAVMCLTMSLQCKCFEIYVFETRKKDVLTKTVWNQWGSEFARAVVICESMGIAAKFSNPADTMVHFNSFKMIPLLVECGAIDSLWGQYNSKYGIRSRLKSCKINTSGHEESIKNMSLLSCLCGVMSFLLSGQLTTAGGCQVWTVQALGSSTRLSLDHVIEINEHWWNQIPVTISMIIHANQSPCHFICESMQIKPLPLHLFMSLLWLMWWTFCEIKWFESSF